MTGSIIRYITHCLHQIPGSVSVGLSIILFLGCLLLLIFLGRKRGLKWSAGLLLFEYLFVLFFLAVFVRSVREVRMYNFAPFWSYRAIYGGGKHLFIEIVTNLVAFIPAGFLLGCSFSKVKWWRVVLMSGAFSALIETMQFVFKRGHAEFDDVFHNVLGCLIGYGVYVGIAQLVKSFAKKRAVNV